MMSAHSFFVRIQIPSRIAIAIAIAALLAYQQYFASGFMSLRQTIDTWIFNITGASLATQSSDPNCKLPLPVFTPFPTPPYEGMLFYTNIYL